MKCCPNGPNASTTERMQYAPERSRWGRLLSAVAVIAIVSVAITACNQAPADHGSNVDEAGVDDRGDIRPYSENLFYWQYRGEPVLLLGASGQDNLFNHPDIDPDGLEAHLDLLVASGGNYIRNTMSARDSGNVHPFAMIDGRFDLDEWNEEYWLRLDRLLRLTAERDIIVQIELWDPWDLYGEEWATNPWNPENNVNYLAENTILATTYDSPSYEDGMSYGEPHDFFLTVPELENEERVSSYQARFVGKVLSYSLEYDHVLYCITNEIHPQYPPEWGWYWAQFIKDRAAQNDRRVFVAEMFWQPDLTGSQHRASLDHPETYDYFEASQNSAVLDPEENWSNLQEIRRELKSHPRPMNHTKIYGADTGPEWAGSSQNAAEKFWRNIFGGSASSRFHRPPAGLGLSEPAQRHLRAMRMVTDSLNTFRSVPQTDRLSDRQSNEAYAFGEEGTAYAVYFPDEGAVTLDAESGTYEIRWLDIEASTWQDASLVEDADRVRIEVPGSGHWVALVRLLARRSN